MKTISIKTQVLLWASFMLLWQPIGVATTYHNGETSGWKLVAGTHQSAATRFITTVPYNFKDVSPDLASIGLVCHLTAGNNNIAVYTKSIPVVKTRAYGGDNMTQGQVTLYWNVVESAGPHSGNQQTVDKVYGEYFGVTGTKCRIQPIMSMSGVCNFSLGASGEPGPCAWTITPTIPQSAADRSRHLFSNPTPVVEAQGNFPASTAVLPTSGHP